MAVVFGGFWLRLCGGGACRPLSMVPAPLRRLALAALLATTAPAALAQTAQPPAPPGEPRFDREVVPARGRQIATLRVAEFGRYSIVAESRVGVALQVVDRMAGAGEVAGEAGARDGRVDLFLDRGEVRLVVDGPALGRGEARLSARSFRELSAPEIPRLVEERLVSTELGDLEQRSWWLEIPARRRVVLEAAGRALADLRLWHNGAWLVDAEPWVDTIAPVEGQPLTRVRLTADLVAGLYRLTAYGGPGQSWARGGAEQPLHLRWGIPRRGIAAREAMTIGPFGVERFLVPARASYFRLELPEARPATLGLGAYDPENPFADADAEWSITEQSVPPVAETSWDAGDRPVLVTIEGTPGQSCRLQHFDAAERVELAGKGRYWVGSVSSGAAADSIDATGVLFAWPKKSPERVRVESAQAVELSSARSWARRFNLLDTATLFVKVSEPGTYQLAARGAALEARLEPLLLSPPAGYQPPPLAPAPAEWELDPGYYVLTLVPKEAGVVEAALRARGAALAGAAAPSGAVRLGVVELRGDTSYVLLLNDQPGVVAGPIARQLPLDLEAALPLSLAPGETVEIPARARVASFATARAEDGTRLELAGPEGNWSEELELPPGEQRIRVRSTRGETVAVTVGFEPIARRASTPLPPPPESLAALPDLPRLDEAGTRFFDLEKGQGSTFLVDAGAPALYLLETTGLLATEGSLRTRVRPRLAEAAENGSGRNAALRAYLREGDYQLTVRARGESAGHLGVRLRRAPVADGGTLADGETARATLPADGAVAYRFAVAERSRWRISALALGGGLALRVEDLDGWPVGPAVAAPDSTFELEPGDYRALVLPRGTPARAVTRLARVVEAERRAGHGPHPLALGVAAEHVWTEPAEGGERAADRWLFTLPAPAQVTARLSSEMAGEILRLGGAGERVGEATASRPFHGELAAGDYALDVRCSRRNHLAAYSVAVDSEELLVGVERDVASPASLTLSVGAEEEVEISSFGDRDVRGRLFGGDGAQIDASDDRPDDWNFLIARRLAPGRYRLRVDPVGAGAAPTRIAVRRRGERTEAPWRLEGGIPRGVEPAADAALVPLDLPHGAELLAIGGHAAEPVALVLEHATGDTWSVAARAEGRSPLVALPLDPGLAAAAWRLRVRSLDGRATPVSLTAFAGAPPRVDEGALARGVRLAPLAGLEPPLALVAVDVGRPGCFAVAAEPGEGELLAARAAGGALEVRPGLLVAAGPRLWLGARAAGSVAARRVAIAAEPVALTLAGGERVRCDLAPAPGGAPVAVTADALAGELALAAFPGAPALVRADRGAAFAPHRALALARAASQVEVGNAGGAAVELRLSARPLAEAPGGALAAGALDLELPSRAARRVTLPAGGSDLAVALAPGTAALAGGRLAWAAGAATLAELAAAEDLLVANPTDLPLAVRVERPAGAPAATPAIAAGAPFERRFTRAGSLAVEIAPAPPGARLEVRGASAAFLVGAAGGRAEGASMAAPQEGGTLFVEHGAGALVAWLASDDDEAAAAGLHPPADDVEILELPAAVDPTGGRRDFAIELAAPAILTLRSPSPAAAALFPADGAARAAVFTERLLWTVALPAGRAAVALRGLGGEALAGRLELAAAPIVAAVEGLGEAVRLAPGSALGYGFALDRERPVGVGVAADSGGAEVILFDGAGRPLGHGAALFRTLPAGEYRFALVAPAEGAPTLVRPAVVGLAPTPDGPPEAAVRALLAAERGEAPPARAVAGSEDARRWFEDGRDETDTDGGEGDEMEGEEYEGGDSGESGGYGVRGAGVYGGAR